MPWGYYPLRHYPSSTTATIGLGPVLLLATTFRLTPYRLRWLYGPVGWLVDLLLLESPPLVSGVDSALCRPLWGAGGAKGERYRLWDITVRDKYSLELLTQ